MHIVTQIKFKLVEFDQFRKVVRAFSVHTTQLLGISQ